MQRLPVGRAPELAASNLIDLILGRPRRAATRGHDDRRRGSSGGGRSALGNQPGAVVALDPRTGDVLAMVANPTYDPNLLASQDPTEVRAAWERLNADPEQAAPLAGDGRAVPAGLDVQARHGVGGARERVRRPRQRVPEPARAGPAADRRHAGELRQRASAWAARRRSRSTRRSRCRAT